MRGVFHIEFLFITGFWAIFLLPNFKPSFGFEYNVFPFLIIALPLFVLYTRQAFFSPIEACIIILLILSVFPAIIMGGLITFIKDTIFLTTVLFGIRYFKFVRENNIKFKKHLIIIIFINCVVAVGQIVGLGSLFDLFLIRQFGGGTNRSVVSALYGEPSQLAIACTCFIFLLGISKGFKPIKKLYASLIILSISSFSLLVGAFVTAYWLLHKKKIIVGLFLITVLCLLLFVIPTSIRFISVIKALYEQGLLVVMLDDSIGSRFDYIARDLKVSYSNYFLPHWLGSYQLLISNDNYVFHQTFGAFGQKEDLSGSLFGHFIVELGLVFLLFIAFLLYKSVKNGGFFLLFALLLLVLLMFQMISLVFYPVAFTLGYIIGFGNVEKVVSKKVDGA